MTKFTTDIPDNNMELLHMSSGGLDQILPPAEAPVSKLDADQFMAEDLDGITETLSGSGHMNFLLLQSAQTNGLMSGRDGMEWNGLGDTSLLNADARDTQAQGSLAGTANDFAQRMNGANPDTDRALNNENRAAQDFERSDGGFNNTTLGANDSSVFSARGNNAFAVSDSRTATSGSDGHDGTTLSGIDGHDGASGNNGTNGASGSNGANGSNGNGGHGDTTINIINVPGVTEVITIVNTTITDTVHVVETITHHIIDHVVDTVTDILNPGEPDHDISVTPEISILGHTIDLPTLSPTLNPVENLVGDIDLHIAPAIDLFGPGEISNANGDHDITVNTDLNLLDGDLLNLGLNIPLDPVESLLGDIDLNVDLAANILGSVADPLIDSFAGGVADGLTDNIGAVVSDIAGTLLGQGGPNTGDHDLSLSLGNNGQPIADLNLLLNPVEDIAGDIDIGAGANLDLLNAGHGETSNAAGDTDIVLNLDLDLAGHNLLNLPLNIALDPVEAITGDIDLNLNVAVDLLGNVASPLLDNLPGGSAAPGLIAEITHSVTDPLVSALPLDILPPDGIDLGALTTPLTDTVNGIITGGQLSDLGGTLQNLLGGLGDTNSGISSQSTTSSSPQIPDILAPIATPVILVDTLANTIVQSLDVTPAIDLLSGSGTQGVLSGTVGAVTGVVDSVTHWPETTLPSNPLADAVSSVTQTVATALPDPIGHVAEGLGSLGLHNTPLNTITHHFGGLFG